MRADLQIPEFRAFSYILMTADDVASQVGVTPDMVKQEYEARAGEFGTAEKRDVDARAVEQPGRGTERTPAAHALTRLVQNKSIQHHPLHSFCAAISVGIVGGVPVLDLPYVEDSTAEVDMNVVMLGNGRFVEVQGTAEGTPFTRGQMDRLLALAEPACRMLSGLP